jgi:hypothetical protein
MLGSDLSLWWIGDACASGIGSLRTIFFSIVRLLVPCGMLSLVACRIGLCPAEWLICLCAGGRVVALRVL